MKLIAPISLGIALAVLGCDSDPTGPTPPPAETGVQALVAGYARTDLGTLGGDVSEAQAINNGGQIVGGSLIVGNSIEHAFLWQNGVMRDLGTLGGDSSVASGINATGQVVGASRTASGDLHAFLWQNGVMRDLGTLGGTTSRAWDINNQGQVVGYSSKAGGAIRAFLWQNGVMQELPLGPRMSRGIGINNNGQIVGDHNTSAYPYYPPHAYLFSNGVETDLGTFGGRQSNALAINPNGKVVGWAMNAAGELRAFLWVNGSKRNLGTLGGLESVATGINSVGQVVGYSTISTFGARHVFVWLTGAMTDLGAGTAADINKSGWIVGSRPNANGNNHATVWKPN